MLDYKISEIGAFLVFGYAFCLFIWLVKGRDFESSFFICLSVWFVSNFIMLIVEPALYVPTGNIGLDRFIWYFGFGIVDILSIYLIVLIHKARKISYTITSFLVCVIFFVQCSLQFSRYIDRVLLKTNLLGALYENGVTVVNCLGLILLMISISLYKNGDKDA